MGRRAVCVDLSFRYLDEIARARFAVGCDLTPRRFRVAPTRRRIQRAARFVVPITRAKGRQRSDSDHLSQRELARHLGMSRDTLWKLERLARDSRERFAGIRAREGSVLAAAEATG